MNHPKIAVISLGNRNAGKSSTWYTIFRRVIRTGIKQLRINSRAHEVFVKNSSFEETDKEVEGFFDVFVRNASFEEYGDEIEDFFDEDDLPNIIFCSVQYTEKGKKTITWFQEHGYYLYIQWLNPGHYDNQAYPDRLAFEEAFKDAGTFTQVSGKEKTERCSAIIKFLSSYLKTQ